MTAADPVRVSFSFALKNLLFFFIFSAPFILFAGRLNYSQAHKFMRHFAAATGTPYDKNTVNFH
jgi:hypothetical protein